MGEAGSRWELRGLGEMGSEWGDKRVSEIGVNGGWEIFLIFNIFHVLEDDEVGV